MLVIHPTTLSVSRKFMYIYGQGRAPAPSGSLFKAEEGLGD